MQPETVQIVVRVPRQLRTAVNVKSKKTNVPVQKIIAAALANWVKEQDSEELVEIQSRKTAVAA